MSNLFSPVRAHLIAEVGVNHGGNLGKAMDQIRLAADGGADSVKLQYYKAELLASEIAEAYWDIAAEPEKTQAELFKKYDFFGASEIETLSALAHELGLRFGLSVFHLGAAEEVSPFVDFFKVASGDITFLDMVEEIARQGKPIVVSTGAASEMEVMQVAQLLENHPDLEKVFLQCTLSYPTRTADANVRSLEALKRLVGENLLGVSDHIPEPAPLRFQLAFALGARVFEKHFSDTPGVGGNDHYHSWGPAGFSELRKAIDEAEALLGPGDLLLESELPARKGARRSLFFSHDLLKGHRLTKKDFIALRPGTGVPIDQVEYYVGRTLSQDVFGRSLVLPQMLDQ